MNWVIQWNQHCTRRNNVCGCCPWIYIPMNLLQGYKLIWNVQWTKLASYEIMSPWTSYISIFDEHSLWPTNRNDSKLKWINQSCIWVDHLREISDGALHEFCCFPISYTNGFLCDLVVSPTFPASSVSRVKWRIKILAFLTSHIPLLLDT